MILKNLYCKQSDRTLKMQLLDQWKRLEDVCFLELLWRLQISLCTRITWRYLMRVLKDRSFFLLLIIFMLKNGRYWEQRQQLSLQKVGTSSSGLALSQRWQNKLYANPIWNAVGVLETYWHWLERGASLLILWPDDLNPYSGIKIHSDNSQLWCRKW